MAVIQYSNVYRSGASSGAPVTSLFLCDTVAELPTSRIEGDIAYVKSEHTLWMWNTFNWYRLVTELFAYDLTLLGPAQSKLILNNSNTVSKVRVMALDGALHISTNCWFDGAAWHVDDTNFDGQIIVQAYTANQIIFYRIRAADGGVEAKFTFDTSAGNFVAAGPIYERNRNYAIGQTNQWAYSSGNFWANGGTVVPTGGNNYYNYWQIGDRVYVSFFMTVTAAGSFSEFYQHVPIGAPTQPFEAGAITLYDAAIGHCPGRVFSGAGRGYLTFYKLPIAAFTAGIIEIGGQFSYASS